MQAALVGSTTDRCHSFLQRHLRSIVLNIQVSLPARPRARRTYRQLADLTILDQYNCNSRFSSEIFYNIGITHALGQGDKGVG